MRFLLQKVLFSWGERALGQDFTTEGCSQLLGLSKPESRATAFFSASESGWDEAPPLCLARAGSPGAGRIHRVIG